MGRMIFFVFLGGGLGSVLRFFLSQLNNNFSYGTMIANLFGSLLIGFVIGLLEKNIVQNIHYLTLAVGFCGGFTTFSSFASENLKLIQNGNYMQFGIYTLLSIGLGITMVLVGIKSASLIGK